MFNRYRCYHYGGSNDSHINGRHVNYSVYADNTVLFCPSLAGLQTVLGKFADYITAVQLALKTPTYKVCIV